MSRLSSKEITYISSKFDVTTALNDYIVTMEYSYETTKGCVTITPRNALTRKLEYEFDLSPNVSPNTENWPLYIATFYQIVWTSRDTTTRKQIGTRPVTISNVELPTWNLVHELLECIDV